MSQERSMHPSSDDFLGAFNYGVRYGIQYAFDEAIHRHDIAMGDISVWGVRGYREFIERPHAASVWILRPEVARGVRSHQVSMVGTVAEYIDRGQLRLKTKRGGRCVFEWDPGCLANFNVIGEASHHVVLYVKRGRYGENDPPSERNRPHQIWRLGADLNTRQGGRTTWRAEEVVLARCSGHGHQGGRRASRGVVRSVQVADGVERSQQMERWIRELVGHGITRPAEISDSACLADYAVWRLRELSPNGRAPFVVGANSHDAILSNPASRIHGGGAGEFTVPRLTRMEVAVQVQGGWRRLGTDVSGVSRGDRVRVTVESENVPSSTGLAVRIYAGEDGEWDEVQDTITGRRPPSSSTCRTL